MKKNPLYKKTILMIFVLLFLLTSCGQEKPPVNYNPPVSNNTGNTGNDQTEFADFVDNIPENSGNSKPIDITPVEGLHITAEENAFWTDTEINVKPRDDSTENVQETEQKLYEDDGILMLAGFEIDAGLADDEYMPGSFDVEYDLSTTDIDPKLYEYLRVYRVGDNGEYYELIANVEDGILKFASNQNSVLVTGVLLAGLGTAIGIVANDEYKERERILCAQQQGCPPA